MGGKEAAAMSVLSAEAAGARQWVQWVTGMVLGGNQG